MKNNALTIDKNTYVLISILWFIFGFAITSLIASHVITMDRYVLVIIYLVAMSTGLIAYFRNQISLIVQDTKWQEAVTFIGISLLFHALTSYVILTYFEQPIWPFESRNTSFLLMNKYYVWAKPIDVFVQHVLINLLVFKLRTLKLNLRQITKIIVITFGCIHIFQALRTELIISYAYTAVAIIFSFLFPKMILQTRNGYIYNFMIHLAVYNVAALIAWTLY